jgi:UDP-glucose:glycoprotein glucosyltransferase
LAGKPVSDELRKEVMKNQDKLGSTFGLMPGDNAMFINGRQADLEVYDVFTLLDQLRSEAKLMEGLHLLASQVKFQLCISS